jgi:hypothetical protein
VGIHDPGVAGSIKPTHGLSVDKADALQSAHSLVHRSSNVTSVLSLP